MIRLITYSMWRTIRRHPSTAAFLFLGLLISFFTMSVVLGYVAQEYSYETQLNAASTISVWSEKRFEKDSVQDFLESGLAKNASNILLIAKSGDYRIIGWKGYGIAQWFPHSTGRFFTDQEEERAAAAAYIRIRDYDEGQKSLLLDGNIYSVIGAGFLTSYNIMAPIAAESKQDVFPHNAYDDLKIAILPYSTWLQYYEPEMLLVHFEQASVRELKNYRKQLGLFFDDAEILLPRWNSDDYYDEKREARGKMGFLLVLLCGMTILRFMRVWIRGNLFQYALFYRHGLGKKRIYLLAATEWSLYLLAAWLLASLLHRMFIPLLALLDAGKMPSLSACIPVAVIFLASGMLISGIVFRTSGLIGRENDD